MRIQTILNRVEKFKSFVSGEERLEEPEMKRPSGTVRFRMLPSKEQSGVLLRLWAAQGPVYDCLEERRFEFTVPLLSGVFGLLGVPDAASELQAGVG